MEKEIIDENKVFHDLLLKQIKKLKGISNIMGYFDNPNSYGDIYSSYHFEFQPKGKSYIIEAELKYSHKRKVIFLPDIGNIPIIGKNDKENIKEILTHTKNRYSL